MCCPAAALAIEPCCFGGSGAREGTVGLSRCITSSVLQLCVGASRLAGGGLGSILLAAGEAVRHSPPSLPPLSWDSFQLLGLHCSLQD